jgi:hypothetical protein
MGVHLQKIINNVGLMVLRNSVVTGRAGFITVERALAEMQVSPPSRLRLLSEAHATTEGRSVTCFRITSPEIAQVQLRRPEHVRKQRIIERKTKLA